MEIRIVIGVNGEVEVWKSESVLKVAVQNESAHQTLTSKFGVQETPTEQQVFKREEAAQFLRLSVPTLDRLVKRKLLKPNVATGRPLFLREELMRFMRDCTASI